ncbi:MAG: DUF423 domain-containing protein [Pseudomonadota bacterium]|nr:DUF423 domain-containing protein [Pseudomonadota bacterium]
MTVIHLQILIALGCLMGAAGVALTALGAHSRPGAGLESAGSMLLFHAPAVMAATFVLGGFPLGFVAIAGFILGAGLFAGDIALQAYRGRRLFRYAAPAGGLILIASWLLLALAALLI